MLGMECKLCSKKFSNGKALGGHMRSHYATLPLPPKTPQRQELGGEPHAESTSSVFSLDERESSGGGGGAVSYGLRENPKKSFRLIDPEFYDAGSVGVGGENESESTREGSKRAKGRRLEDDDEVVKSVVLGKPSSEEELAELEMEEDVALSLVMLSRGVRRNCVELRISQIATGKTYKCERCDKVFKSSQGLGSHRVSHFKKLKSSFDGVRESEFSKPKIVLKEQTHECPFCGKIFKSAHALGGHKRTHSLASNFGESLVCTNVSGDKLQDADIYLNLPAEMEGEDEEHVNEGEGSVSDAEFVNHIKHWKM